MCRNIKRLRRADGSPTDKELHDAALQFVRKITGYRAPSKANREAFHAAVEDVAAASRTLFDSLRVRPLRRAGRGVDRSCGVEPQQE
jgi:hypothetical protein